MESREPCKGSAPFTNKGAIRYHLSTTGTLWLRDLLPDLAPNARVLSFGYGVSESSIAVAEAFLSKLVEMRRETGVSPLAAPLEIHALILWEV